MELFLKNLIIFISKSNIIYIVMFFIFFIGLYFCIKLIKIKKNFNQAIKYINNLDSDNDELKIYLHNENIKDYKLFILKDLDERFKDYKNEVINSSENTYIDLAKYINIDFIDEKAKVEFCELVSSLMTGIGIFGTFLGLVIGVKGIDLNNSETLMQGISGLLNGVSFAFMTSIVGVFLSVVFSLIYKPLYASTINSMNSFLELFHNKNYDQSSEHAVNKLLKYQEKQTEVLQNITNQVALTISSSMAKTFSPVISKMEKAIENFGNYQEKQTEAIHNFTNQVSTTISTSISEVLSPLISKMEKTIEEFGKFASQQQKEGLEKVVKKFIDSMNKSLGGQFEELGNTIKSLCEWQKSSVLQMQKIVDGICETSNQIEKINEISQNTIIEMNNFVVKINQMQDSINEGMNLAAKHIEQGNIISEKNAAYIEKLVECEDRISNVAEKVKEQAVASLETVKLLKETTNENIQSIAEATQKTIKLCDNQLELLGAATQDNIDEKIQMVSNTAQDEMQLLSDTSSKLANDNHKQLKTLTNSSNKQMKIISDNASSLIKENQQLIDEFREMLQSQYNDLAELTGDFTSYVKKQNNELAQSVENLIDVTTKASETNAKELNKATKAMISASQTLDSSLENALDKTFTSFDTGLTEITQHLSGTIADVRDTVESLPILIQQSQKIYEKTLADLSNETKRYCERIQKLNNELEKKIHLINKGVN